MNQGFSTHQQRAVAGPEGSAVGVAKQPPVSSSACIAMVMPTTTSHALDVRTRQDKTRQDKTRRDETRQDKKDTIRQGSRVHVHAVHAAHLRDRIKMLWHCTADTCCQPYHTKRHCNQTRLLLTAVTSWCVVSCPLDKSRETKQSQASWRTQTFSTAGSGSRTKTGMAESVALKPATSWGALSCPRRPYSRQAPDTAFANTRSQRSGALTVSYHYYGAGVVHGRRQQLLSHQTPVLHHAAAYLPGPGKTPHKHSWAPLMSLLKGPALAVCRRATGPCQRRRPGSC